LSLLFIATINALTTAPVVHFFFFLKFTHTKKKTKKKKTQKFEKTQQ
jgi:hypothetical protein